MVRILREKTVVIPNLAEKSRNFCPYSSPGSKPVKKLLLDSEHTESGMLGFNSSVPKPACWPNFPKIQVRSSPPHESAAGFPTLQSPVFHHFVEAPPNSRLDTR
uniref:Uncharacterized protein n=1 Tax=Fagus sylvatica TaxID=28930 RepID=A0A2N9H6C3_FAGSY